MLRIAKGRCFFADSLYFLAQARKIISFICVASTPTSQSALHYMELRAANFQIGNLPARYTARVAYPAHAAATSHHYYYLRAITPVQDEACVHFSCDGEQRERENFMVMITGGCKNSAKSANVCLEREVKYFYSSAEGFHFPQVRNLGFMRGRAECVCVSRAENAAAE